MIERSGVNALVTFLRARLDHDEQLATLASDGYASNWEAVRGAYGPEVRAVGRDEEQWTREIAFAVWTCEDEVDGCPDVTRGLMSEAEHIARHDPARVLREVEAKRKRLDFLESLGHDMGDEDFPTYSSCRALNEPGSLGDIEVGYCSCGRDVLRRRMYLIEAMPYSDHPDFQSDWGAEGGA